MSKFAMDAIRLFVLWVTIMIWLFVGFFVWIPLLIRQVAVFSAGVLYCTILGSDSSHLQKPLEIAMGFYVYGFQQIFKVITKDENPGYSSFSNADQELDWNKIGRFFLELLWTCLFWGIFIFFISV